MNPPSTFLQHLHKRAAFHFTQLASPVHALLPKEYGVSGTPRKVETMAFDEASRVNNLTYDTKTYASAFTYNAASQTTALTVGHNVAGYSRWEESYTYEPATGLLSNQKVKLTGASTPSLDLSYEYLKQGTTVGRTGQLTKIINNKDTSKNKYYEYDSLSRLKKLYSFTGTDNPMTTNQWTQTYGFDKFGNRTSVAKTGTVPVADGLAALTFTDANNKVKTNRITTAGYSYDEAGNLTRGQSDGGVWQKYQYDAAGRLACTKDDSDVKLAEYCYGASNHRLKQIEYTSGVGTTCYYAWDGNSIIGEFNDVSSALTWMKSYVFLGGRLLATHTPGGTNFHHPDRLGTRLITSEMGGTVTAEQTTLPYGTALDGESMGTPSNRRFTSYDRSSKTKLDYAVNRFYSSCQGRFTQVDPIGMAASSLEDPQSLNLYAYVGGDPINRIDPEGLFFKQLFGAIKKFLSNRIVQIAMIAALIIITYGAANWGWTLIIKGTVLGGHAGGTMGTTILIGGKATLLGKTAAVLSALTGASFQLSGVEPTPPIFGIQRGGGGRPPIIPRARQVRPRIIPPHIRPRNNREVRSQGPPVLSTTAPTFPNLKNHTIKHGEGMTRAEYYNDAVSHVQGGQPGVIGSTTGRFLVRHDGQAKWNYVTRIGADQFKYTSTSSDGRTIFTHMFDKTIDTQYLRNKGITLPNGF